MSAQTTPSPDFRASLDFLRRWLPEGPWCLTAIPFARGHTTTATFYANDGDAKVWKWLATHNERDNSSVYFVPNPVRGRVTRKARREDIGELVGFHVDLDPRAGEDLASEQVRILELAKSERPKDLPNPTAVIFSGGGYQLLWRLAEPITIRDVDHAEDLKRYNIQIENLLGGDHCHDVCRLLRLPGTVNWLSEKKVRAGRQPVRAELVEFWDERLYQLAAFIAAPTVQDAAAASRDDAGGRLPARRTAVSVSANIRRLDDVDELGDEVSGLCKVVIVQGDDPDDPVRFGGDRSKAVWYVACELVRRGIDDDTVFSVLTDPDFRISAHVLEQRYPQKYALRQIQKAKEAAIDPDLREFNGRYIVIKNFGGKCVVCEEIEDDQLGRTTLSAMSVDHFKLAYANRRKQVGEDSIPIAAWWFAHRERRQYERVVFRPDGDLSDCYNLWRGFAIEPVPGDCSLFLTHLREVLCRGREDLYTYLVSWMASAVQRPGHPGQVAVVLKGRQGTGKSFFAEVFGHLFGRHYMAIRDAKHLVGNFNSHLRDCVILFADEAFYAGDRKHESILKGLITEHGLTIEGKYRDVEFQRNCLHVIMASNEDWAVPAALDDRRFFILDVGEDRRNQCRHFASIKAQMKDGGYSALLDHLLKVDLAGFELSVRPETEALREEKLNSMEPVAAWWYQRLWDGEILFPGAASGGWPTVALPKAQLYAEIRRSFHAHVRYTDQRIGRLFKGLVPDLTELRPEGRRHWVDHRGAEFDADRPRCWVLPPLEKCRDAWDRWQGTLATWPGVNEDSPGKVREPF